MKKLLNNIRQPQSISISKKVLYSFLIFMIGVLLGFISKILDTVASNALPYFLQVLDLGNFLSRLGVWVFFGVVISLYSKTPLRASLNVFLFFAGMVGSYYFYTVAIAGFFPKSYMMIWIILTVISPVFAFVSWYAKGEGIIAVFISSIIFMFITSQAFVFGFWYFDITYIPELFIWIATIFALYQSPKQIIKVVVFGMALFIAIAPFFNWGF